MTTPSGLPGEQGTTPERLVRTVRHYGPDGSSVSRTESLDVLITWPNGKPESLWRGYLLHGEWVVVPPEEPVP